MNSQESLEVHNFLNSHGDAKNNLESQSKALVHTVHAGWQFDPVTLQSSLGFPVMKCVYSPLDYTEFPLE